MSFKFDTAIYFNNNEFPTSSGSVKISNNRDWVNSIVDGIGKRETILVCRAMPYRKIEDFHDYFSRNEIIWYKFFISLSKKIIKILRIKSFGMSSSEISSFEIPFPKYLYTLRSKVTDVQITDDENYKTYTDFYIKYDSSYDKEVSASN